MFCKRCRYNLAHLTTDQCPECGRAFELGNVRTYRKRAGFPKWVRHLGKLTLAVFVLLLIAVGVIEWRYQRERVVASELSAQGHDVFWSDSLTWASTVNYLHVRLQHVDHVETFGNLDDGTIQTFTKLRGVTWLVINGPHLASMPDSIGKLTEIESLKIRNAALTTLPAEIGNLTAVTDLEIRATPIASLPDSIGNLRSLANCRIEDTQLSDLPATFAKLHNLRWLCLNGNQFNSLPPVLFEMDKLEELFVNHDQLTSLPTAIGELKKLEVLGLWSNQLTALPTEIGRLKKLAELDVGNNPLDDKSLDVLRPLHNLRFLNLSGTKVTKAGIDSLKIALPACEIRSDF